MSPARRTTSVARRALRAAALAGHVMLVWLVAELVLPRLAAAPCRRLMARLAAHTLAILRVRPRPAGAYPLRAGPVLLVANHVSWLDVYALNVALGGTRSVAKREVAAWPVAGAIARGCRTFFHERGNIRDAARVKDAVAAALRSGERVVVFPEGITTEGDGVAPFRAAFLQAAVDAGVPVQPVAIRYPNTDGAPDPAAAFVGDMTFLASLARVLRRESLDACLTFGPPIASPGRSRRDLAATSHAFIARVLAGGALATLPRPARLPVPRAA